MKTLWRCLVICILLSILMLVCVVPDLLTNSNPSNFLPTVLSRTKRYGIYSNPQQSWHHRDEHRNLTDEIRVAVVACNDRLEESLTMIKSVILLTSSPLRIYVFADEDLKPDIEKQLSVWRYVMQNSFSYEMIPISFPESKDYDWKRLFRPCSAQRLFILDVLTEVDSIIYLDSDSLFLGPVEEVWNQLPLMNTSHIAAMANESHTEMRGFYNHFYIRHPIFGDFGVNAGVLLMNLTRMRAFNWTDLVVAAYSKYQHKLILGDQDIINIIFSSHPDKLLVMPCRYNYRTEHCDYGCPDVERHGASIVHGSRMSFHAAGNSPGFNALYSAMRDYELGTDPYVNLFSPLKEHLDQLWSVKCGNVREVLLKAMATHFKRPEVMLTVIT